MPEPKRRRLGAILGWVFFLLVAGAIAATIYKRDAVMAQFPASAPVFELLGLAAEPPVTLRVEDIKLARATTQDGVPVLQIEGRIVNTGSAARSVPTLRGILQDGAEREVQSWTFSAPSSRLEAGESVGFRTEVRQPAAAAARVSIIFTDPR